MTAKDKDKKSLQTFDLGSYKELTKLNSNGHHAHHTPPKRAMLDFLDMGIIKTYDQKTALCIGFLPEMHYENHRISSYRKGDVYDRTFRSVIADAIWANKLVGVPNATNRIILDHFYTSYKDAMIKNVPTSKYVIPIDYHQYMQSKIMYQSYLMDLNNNILSLPDKSNRNVLMLPDKSNRNILMLPDKSNRNVLMLPDKSSRFNFTKFTSLTAPNVAIARNLTSYGYNIFTGRESIGYKSITNLGQNISFDIADNVISQGLLSLNAYGKLFQVISIPGEVYSCNLNQMNWLKEHDLFDSKNGMRSLSYCANLNSSNLVKSNNLGMVVAKQLHQSHAYRTPEQIYDLTPLKDKPSNYLTKFVDGFYDYAVYPSTYVVGSAYNTLKYVTHPLRLVDSAYNTVINAATYGYNNLNNFYSSFLNNPSTSLQDLINSNSEIIFNNMLNNNHNNFKDLFNTNDIFNNKINVDNTNKVKVFENLGVSVKKVTTPEEIDRKYTVSKGINSDFSKDFIDNFYDKYSNNKDLKEIIFDSFNDYIYIKDGKIVKTKDLINITNGLGYVDKQNGIADYFNKLEMKSKKYQAMLAAKYKNTTKFIGHLNMVYDGLSAIKGFKDLKRMSDIQKLKFFNGLAMNYLYDLPRDVSNGASQIINIAANLIETGKIEFENLVGAVIATKFNVPVRGLTEVLSCLHNKDADVGKAITHLALDVLSYFNPYVKVAMIIYNIGEVLLSFCNKSYEKKIGGFDVKVDESVKVKVFKFKKDHKVIMSSSILDINVTSYNKKKYKAREECEKQFVKEAKIKAYQVFGTPYEFFDPDFESPKHRLAKIRQSIYIQSLSEKWQDINNISEEDKKMLSDIKKSEEDVKLQIKEEKQEIIKSFYSLNKSKDIITFTNDFIKEIKSCSDNTLIAQKIYSLIYDTGSDDKVVFSPIVKEILKYLNIDSNKLEEYINHKKDYDENTLNKMVNEEYDTKQKEYVEFLVALRNKRNANQNGQLTNAENTEKNLYENNLDKYNRSEIIKYLNRELLKYDVSVENFVNTSYSSAIGITCSTIGYIDYEIQHMRQRKCKYVYDKAIIYTKMNVQSYFSDAISRHASKSIEMMECMDEFSDDFIKDYVYPNVGMISSISVSAIASVFEKRKQKKSFLEKSYDIIENSIKTNLKNINTYLTKNILTWKEFMNNAVTYVSSYGLDQGLASIFLPGILTICATRFLRWLIFPKKKSNEIKQIENEPTTKNIVKVSITEQYYEMYNSSQGFYKDMLKHEMIKMGIYKSKEVPIKRCFNKLMKDFGKPSKPVTIKEINEYGNNPSHHNYNNTNVVKLKDLKKKRETKKQVITPLINTRSDIYSTKIVKLEEINKFKNKNGKEIVRNKNTDKERNLNVVKSNDIKLKPNNIVSLKEIQEFNKKKSNLNVVKSNDIIKLKPNNIVSLKDIKEFKKKKSKFKAVSLEEINKYNSCINLAQ